MLVNGELLLTTSAKITTPILVAHGTADPINKFAATKEMFEHISSSDKNLLGFDGCYHECKGSLFFFLRSLFSLSLRLSQLELTFNIF
jgi:alpha-beta hydrolase superfamily lysophospholipase